MAYYGAYAGPESAKFRACVDFKVTEQGDTQYRASVRYWVEATGNFYGTYVKTSWGEFQMYDAGTYLDTGWCDWGWHDWGTALSADVTAGYTGGSGTYYSSRAAASWTPATPTWQPYAPSGAAHKRVSDSRNDVSWSRNARAARPYSSLTVQRSVDGGAWTNIKTGLGGSATSYSDTATSSGHSYSYRVVAVNSAGSKASAATTKTLNTPSKPTGVANSRQGDNRNDVSWTRVAPDSALYASQDVQRSTDGGAWANLATGLSGGATSYTDRTTAAGHSYMYRVVAHNATGSATSAASAKTLNTPTAPSGATASRVSDTRNDVSWSRNCPDSALYASQQVQRSTDDGDWATVATLTGSATSYADTSTAAGHSYRYRVGAVNSAGTRWSGATSTLYNSPTAPTLSAQRVGGTTVRATVGSVSRTATAWVLERQKQGGSWVTVGSYGTSTAYVDDAPGAGTWRYRARATRPGLTSGYCDPTGWVTPMSAPGAPGISSPASGQVLASGAAASVSWSHSPTDGSAQQAFEAQLSRDGGATWEALASGTSASSCALSLAGEVDAAVRVRTRGVSPDWGPWATVTFYVRRPPAVTVTVGPEVDAVPFAVAWDVGDMSGSVQSSTLSVAPEGGSPVLTLELGDALSHSVGADELVPADGQDYVATVEVVSTYGLRSSGSAAFSVSYDAPGVPDAVASVDREAGAVSLVAHMTAGGVPTESLSVWREGRCLGSGLPDGCEVVDPLPPLDRAVCYEVVARAESGAVSRRRVSALVPSDSYAFLNFGRQWRQVAKAARNLAVSGGSKREVETMQVFGKKHPVAMYGEHVDTTGSLSADVDWIEDADGAGAAAMLAAWREAEAHMGDYALRLPAGEAVRVRADIDDERGDVYGVATVRVDWEEVAGGLD